MADRELVNIDGWLTDDPDEYRNYAQTGLRWTFKQQLAVDVRSWKPWAFWVAGGLAFGQAAVQASSRPATGIPFLILGLAVWSTYLRMLVPVVRGRQRARLLEATVKFDGRHPLMRTLVTGTFVEVGGTVIGRTFLADWAAERTKRADGSHRVLIAYDSAAEMSAVVGVRPAEPELLEPAPTPRSG